MKKIKTLCKISLVSIALVLFLVSSTALAATEKSASPKITETQITNDGHAENPTIYGDKIVWKDDRNGNSNIYMYDLLTKKETQISSNESIATELAIYGDKIVWTDSRNSGFLPNAIYMYDLSTKKESLISENSIRYVESPAIYGDKIIWVEYLDDFSGFDMYDISTKKETQITNSELAYQLAIYRNKIVWADHRSGNYDIYMYDISTKKETQITSSPDDQTHPDVYGNRIVWEDDGGDDDGGTNYGIYMYDISTNQKMKISTNGSAYYPAIYGDKVVWQYGLYENSDIYMATVEVPQPKLPVAAFSASPRSGKTPLKVQFTDKSANSPTS